MIADLYSLLKANIFTMDSDSKSRDMGKECNCGEMVLSMKAIGNTTPPMGKAD